MATMILLPKLYLALVSSLTTQLTQGALIMKQLCGLLETYRNTSKGAYMNKIHTRLVRRLVIAANTMVAGSELWQWTRCRLVGSQVLPLWRCGTHCEIHTRANPRFDIGHPVWIASRWTYHHRLWCHNPHHLFQTSCSQTSLQSRVGEHAPRSVNRRLDLWRCAVLK